MSTIDRSLLATTTVLFATGAAATIHLCQSMSGEMPMPGGWSMSMAWMRMPGQTWFGAGASFMSMWLVMMVAMMLPSLAPMLSMYSRSVRTTDQIRLGGVLMLFAAAYFFVWAVFGSVMYPLGVVLALAEMRSEAFARSVPIAAGAAILLAGCVQLTPWKARELACCRNPWDLSLDPDARSAWKHGIRSGVHCVLCCSSFMTILLVIGVMNLGAMAALAAAITIERFAPRPERVVRAAGVVILAAGTAIISRAMGVA